MKKILIGLCALFSVFALVSCDKEPTIQNYYIGENGSLVAQYDDGTTKDLGSLGDTIANGVEEYGDNWSDAFADTASLHPLKGLKSVGSSFITVGKGVYNLSKLAVSGTFGVLYEFVDECKYIIVPNTTNDSSLNPDEELTIIF